MPVMESFRPQRSLGSERFLSPFPPTNSATGCGVELDEDEIFCTGRESPEKNHPPFPQPPPTNFTRDLIKRSPLSPSSSNGGGFRRERNFGILAALPEEDKQCSLLQRKPSISSLSTHSTSPASSSSSARLIPAITKPKTDFPLSVPGGRIYHQSAPVNVPVIPRRMRRAAADIDEREWVDDDDRNEEEMLPPHEIVARAHGRGSPLTTFSMLEGAGRTLKGRDLCRVPFHREFMAMLIMAALTSAAGRVSYLPSTKDGFLHCCSLGKCVV